MNSNSQKLGLSINDACKISGLGRTSIYREIATGQLKARKAGWRTLILRTDLEAWLNGLPEASAADHDAAA